MGFLSVEGKAIPYDESKKIIPYIKEHGITQFLNLFALHKDRRIAESNLHYGDELEYSVFHLDHVKRQAKLYDGVIELLRCDKLDSEHFGIHPEFGSWMVELVPKKPYHKITRHSLEQMANSMLIRRHALNEALTKYGLLMVSATSVPNLGVGRYSTLETFPENLEEANSASRSRFVLDESANPHPRFGALMRNIRARRGDKVDIKIPLFEDTNTKMTVETTEEPYPGEIYMDSIHFGMGCSCLQLTYEA